jgi:predicted TIM-barrel fold metal-dependent hydrolase
MDDRTPGKVDTHAHYLPSEYVAAGNAAFPTGPDGMPGFPAWNVGMALETMDALNISASVLSVSSPGVHFGDATAARVLARQVNDAGAKVVQTHPGRFGLFASLPLPDVEASLEEIEYAFDALQVDGVVVLTNAQGIYLGDSALEPVFGELNRRGAVVFMHPTSPYCPVCHGSGSDLDFPRPMLEFMFDSTRAVTNLIRSGTLTRCPDIRLIVPHAGAALPILGERIAAFSPGDDVFSSLRALYYDLAGFPLPTMFRALSDIADPSRILYGSDWPFTPVGAVARLAAQLDDTDLIDDEWRAQIYRHNALELFPRLKELSLE